MKKFRAAAVMFSVLAVGLTGCNVAEGAAPTSPPSRSAETPRATPSPTPTPEPDLTAVLVSATEMTLVDEQGETTARLDFHSEDPAAFADALGTAAGVPAVETTTPGGFEGSEFTTEYAWDGLLITRYYSSECLPQCQAVYLSVDASHVADIPIRTASGISVGASLEEAQALGAQQTPNDVWAAEPEDPALIDSESEGTRIVVLRLDEADAAIASFLASGWFLSYGGI